MPLPKFSYFPGKITLFLPSLDRQGRETPLPERVLRQDRVIRRVLSEYTRTGITVTPIAHSDYWSDGSVRSEESTALSFYSESPEDAVRIRDELVPWLIDLYETDRFPFEIAENNLYIQEKDEEQARREREEPDAYSERV